MSGDKPGQARRPAWKTAAEGPSRQGPRYAWKPEGPGDHRPRRRLKQFFIGLAAIGCIALIIWIVKWLQQPPHATLALVGADPADAVDRLDVPSDAYGWQGDRQLAEWAGKVDKSRWGQLSPEVFGGGPASLRAKDFAGWAEKLAVDKKYDPLIVVFGLYGAAGPDGPFLFTAGGERLALRTVIDTFADKRFQGRKIILVLDPARLGPDPALGVLSDDCVRGVQAMEQTVKDAASKLLVICASGPEERSWDSEEWRSSAFTRALIDGLRGYAARPNQTKINAWDLFDYVKRETDRWTALNRPTRQTPVLLPDPEAGGRARAEQIDVAIKVGEPVPAEPLGAIFHAPAELAKCWEECQALENFVPSPAVYTPRLWRRYRELLLRYEHLIRADEKDAAAKLAQVLHNTWQELEDAIALRRDPSGKANLLPLPAALGLADVTTWSDADGKKFRELWNARTKPEVRDPLWAKMQEDAGATVDAQRLRLTAYLLNLGSDSGGAPEYAADAANLLAYVYSKDPGAVRPAEAHFALMLRAFDWAGPKPQPEKPQPDLMKRVVAVRLLAERAALGMRAEGGTYPYSEQVWPVVRAPVEAADAKRRAGEDLLFTNSEQWPTARTQLAEAETAYKSALDNARLLQAALTLRDRALADLPFLTGWLAAQRPDDIRPLDPIALWGKVHDLDAQLTELANQPEKAPAPALAQLSAATGAVASPLKELTDRFQEQCRSAITEGARLQRQWLQVERLLAVPLIDSKLRVGLIEHSREMSAKFNEAKGGPAEGAAPATEEPARDRAQRQGLLAVAVLGKSLLDAQAGADLLKGDTLRDHLIDLGGSWQDAVNRTGNQIGRHWQKLATDADEAHSRAAVAFAAPAGPDPALVQRKVRWQRLLVGLARRTGLDHWYAEGGDAEPYYRAAMRRFLKDADELVQAPADGAKPTLPGRAEADELLNAKRLTLSAPEEIDWTDQGNRSFDYTVAAPPVLKGDGFVALWPRVPTGQITVPPIDRRREPEPIAAARRSLRLDAPESAQSAELRVGLQGYYRGQWLQAETAVHLDRSAVRIVRRITPPVEAGFAVRADAAFRGAVAIVLDYSGSMAERPGGPPDWSKPDSKIKQALKELRKILADLPTGTPLALRLYGHQNMKGMEKTLLTDSMPDDDRYRVWTRATVDEQIIKKPVPWGPQNLGPLDELMAKLESYQPNGGTPLLRSMIAAKKSDFPEKFVGPRTLLVLTDGADTAYGNSTPSGRSINPQVISQVRKDFKEAFDDQEDITVQMVLFSFDANEWNVALQQFGDVAKFKLPGSIVQAQNAKDLSRELDLALRPKVRLLANGAPVPDVPALPANRANDPLQKLNVSNPVAPGLYELKTARFLQQVRFDAGQRLLVRLSNGSNGVSFRRDLLADDPLWASRRKEQGEWVLGVPQVRDEETSRDRRLKLMVTLETTKGREPGPNGVLQLSPPHSMWWEIVPTGAAGAPPGTLRVNPLYGYPASAWDVTVDGWPADPDPRPPRLTVWCQGDTPPVAKRLQVVPGSPPVPVELDDGQKLTVTVTLATERIYTGREPADVTPPPIPCVVVRILSAAPDRPVQVQLGELPPGIQKPAEEHRYYGSKNYTAVFGPMTPDQVRGRPLELELVSVPKLKAGATEIAFELPRPRRGEPAPQPLKLGSDDR